MSLTKKWSIEKMVVTGNTNLVTHVYWRCDAIDDVNELQASCSGVRNLVASDAFISYGQLTEDQVLSWCFEPEVTITFDPKTAVSITSTKHLKEDGEAQVIAQIERQLAQKQSEPSLPWENLN